MQLTRLDVRLVQLVVLVVILQLHALPAKYALQAAILHQHALLQPIQSVHNALLEPTALLQGLLHALHVLPIPGLCLGQHALPTQGIMMLEPA